MNKSMLVDEDLAANDINLYLQEIGKEISARKFYGIPRSR